MTESFTVDFMGRRICLGDTIVYPVRRRSDMVLKKGVVSESPSNAALVIKQGIVCLNEKNRRVIIEKPERCVVVQSMEERHGNL